MLLPAGILFVEQHKHTANSLWLTNSQCVAQWVSDLCVEPEDCVFKSCSQWSDRIAAGPLSEIISK